MILSLAFDRTLIPEMGRMGLLGAPLHVSIRLQLNEYCSRDMDVRVHRRSAMV